MPDTCTMHNAISLGKFECAQICTARRFRAFTHGRYAATLYLSDNSTCRQLSVPWSRPDEATSRTGRAGQAPRVGVDIECRRALLETAQCQPETTTIRLPQTYLCGAPASLCRPSMTETAAAGVGVLPSRASLLQNMPASGQATRTQQLCTPSPCHSSQCAPVSLLPVHARMLSRHAMALGQICCCATL
jgi:hypothetical protein